MASNEPDAGPQQAPKAWKEMQERYMRKVLVAADDPRYLNGTRRMDGRKRKFAARAPMEVAMSTAELTVAERQEAEDSKRTGDELRRQVIVRFPPAILSLPFRYPFATLSLPFRYPFANLTPTLRSFFSQLSEKRAEATELRHGTMLLKERLNAAEFKLQEARAYSVQQEQTVHSLSAQFHRKERQVKSLLRMEHGRLFRLVTRFVLVVNGLTAEIAQLRAEVRAGRGGDEESSG